MKKRTRFFCGVLLVTTLALAWSCLPEGWQDLHERQCRKRGWRAEAMTVEGHSRRYLWKAPVGPWKGTVVALHGGGGSCTNFGSGGLLGQPMEEFARQALARGFAVFAPDSGDDLARDDKGRGYGKRWDSLAHPDGRNVDLPFLQSIIAQEVPRLRPAGSGRSVFLTGVSNGGFMTILAATHYPELVTAFAPVSCGDPYATYLDRDTVPRMERDNAPGVFRDRATGLTISQQGAGAGEPSGEIEWARTDGRELPTFKQFQCRGDLVVDMSCMAKARARLVAHGYHDDGAFIQPDVDGKPSILEHFWLSAYNEPMLDFFESQTGRP